MGAVRMLARAEMRRRWGSIVVLSLLVGLVGAVVLASAAGARRSASALDRFETESRSADLEINVGETTPEQIAEFRRTPDVEAVGLLRQLTLTLPGGGFLNLAGQVDNTFGHIVDRARVLKGREAHAVDELTIGERLARDVGVGVGDTAEFDSYTPEQVRHQITGETVPAGPHVTFRIVGIVRRPLDLGGLGSTGGVIVPTRAFVEKYRDDIGSFSGNLLRVRTRHGAADVRRVVAAARRIFGADEQFNVQSLSVEGESAQDAIDVTTVGLWILTGVAAAAGLVALALALARYVAGAGAADDALRSLGVRRVQRWSAAMVTVLPPTIAGAVVAVVAAVLASSLFPIGVARDAEPDLGLFVDWTILGVGFIAVVLVVSALGGLAALTITARRAESEIRPGVPTGMLARAGLPPAVSTGVGFALERGAGRTGVPVRGALVGAVAGVLGIVAVLTFASSLDRLETTPALYGWTWDYAARAQALSSVPCRSVDTPFARDAAVESVATLCTGAVDVDDHPVVVGAVVPIHGTPVIGPAIIEGRAPTGSHDIALGRDALDAIGKEIGDTVRVQSRGKPERFRIVGRTVSPSIEDASPLADGAVLTASALRRLDAVNDGFFVLRLAPGIDRVRAVHHLTRIGRAGPLIGPTTPTEVERLNQVDFLAPALAGFVAVVALLAIGYTLVVAVRRRRHDLAILKTIGFRRAQVRTAVACQATTLAVVGLVLGIPLGIVVGRLFWAAVASGLGVSTGISLPIWAIVALVPAAILVTNLVAAWPGRTAALTRPALVLHSE